jgi:glycogen synthase
VVVPYFQLERYIEETLRSVLDQTYDGIEVLVVNDGSLRPEDRCLLELEERYPVTLLTQPNSGLGAARNFGVAHSRGRYVFPLDADNLAHPSFIERCVEVLEHDRDIAFVTSWSRFIDENGVPDDGPGGGYQPMGNSSAMIERNNVAGDAAAVVRRRVFDLGHHYSPEVHSFEDWLFYRELHAAGLFGHVIPERLLGYRVRSDSMIREVGFPEFGRLVGEMSARVRETAVRWTS